MNASSGIPLNPMTASALAAPGSRPAQSATPARPIRLDPHTGVQGCRGRCAMSEMQGDVELAEEVEAATAVLRADVGTWDADLKVTPAPGMAPFESKGVATTRLVGDRWLVVDIESDGGFAGHGVYGWDAAAGEYVSVWVNSMQSSPARGRGRWDAATGEYVSVWVDSMQSSPARGRGRWD